MSEQKTSTKCSWVTGTVKTGPWAGYPCLCGMPADGPHPDPEKGYREPLCRWHRVDAALTEGDTE